MQVDTDSSLVLARVNCYLQFQGINSGNGHDLGRGDCCFIVEVFGHLFV